MQSAEATKPGMRVLIDPVAHEELGWDLLGRPYTIDKVVAVANDDDRCSLKDDRGRIVKWIKATDLLPAPATLSPRERPRVVEKEQAMNAATKQLNLATTIAREKGIKLRDATLEANRQLTDDESDEIRGGSPAPVQEPASSLNTKGLTQGQAALAAEAQRVKAQRGLSSDAEAIEVALRETFGGQTSASADQPRPLPGETYFQFVSRTERERGLNTTAAHHLCRDAAPKLAAAWENGSAL